MEAKRIIKQMVVSFISLVNKGANKKTVIYKSDAPAGETLERTVMIKKVDEEKHMVYGIVYSPEEVDTQGDKADAATIEKAAYDFMKSRRTTQVDKGHDGNPDEGFVAESWITKANDSIFSTDPVGSWAVGIKVEKEDTWQQIKKGEITGLSLSAVARIEEVKSAAAGSEQSAGSTNKSAAVGILERLSKALSIPPGTNIPLLKDFNEQLAAQQLQQFVYALFKAVDSILDDDGVADKKTAILASIDQFKSTLGVTAKADTTALEGKLKSLEQLNKDAGTKATADKTKIEDLTKEVERLKKLTPGSRQVQTTHKSSEGTVRVGWLP